MPQPIINKTALFFFCLPSIFVSVCTSVHLCHQQPRDQAVRLRIHLVVLPPAQLCSMELRLCIVVHLVVLCVLLEYLPPFIYLCWFLVVVIPCPVAVMVLRLPLCSCSLSVSILIKWLSRPASNHIKVGCDTGHCVLIRRNLLRLFHV